MKMNKNRLVKEYLITMKIAKIYRRTYENRKPYIVLSFIEDQCLIQEMFLPLFLSQWTGVDCVIFIHKYILNS